MGASAWEYYVLYRPDLDGALQALREQVLAAGDFYWAPAADAADSGLDTPRPAIPSTIAEMHADKSFWESGTHSILDMVQVVGETGYADFRDVRPISTSEAVQRTGTDLLTRDHIELIADLANERWKGCCAVLRDMHGRPTEICFWGFSGD